jgi:hypothetical protein
MKVGERNRSRSVPYVVRALLIDETAVEKLGARDISEREARQLLWNVNVVTHNSARGGANRQLLIGLTDGGRVLTLVVERTMEPDSWLVVTGWSAAKSERKMLGG